MNQNKEDFNIIDGFEKFLEQKKSQGIIKKSTESNSNTLTNKKREREKEEKTKILFYKEEEDSGIEIEDESSSSFKFENHENLIDNYLDSYFEDNEERLNSFYSGDIQQNIK